MTGMPIPTEEETFDVSAARALMVSAQKQLAINKAEWVKQEWSKVLQVVKKAAVSGQDNVTYILNGGGYDAEKLMTFIRTKGFRASTTIASMQGEIHICWDL